MWRAPVPVAVDVAEHDGGGRTEPDAVCRLHHLEPLHGGDLVRTQHRADFVVEDLGRGPGQRAETRRAEPPEVFVELHAERPRALPDLQRRECMHVDAGRRILHRPADRQVRLARIVGMNPALEADLGRPATPGLPGAARNFREVEIVGPAAQVRAQPTLGERAEPALEVADVGVVDVAVDDVAHGLAVALAAQRIGRLADRARFTTASLEQPDDLRFVERRALAHPIQHLGERTGCAGGYDVCREAQRGRVSLSRPSAGIRVRPAVCHGPRKGGSPRGQRLPNTRDRPPICPQRIRSSLRGRCAVGQGPVSRLPRTSPSRARAPGRRSRRGPRSGGLGSTHRSRSVT